MATDACESTSIDASSRENRIAHIRINLLLPETRIPGENFCCWQYKSIFIRFYKVALESEAKKSGRTDDENRFLA